MINVISRKDIDNLYERHVLHSLAIAKIVKFKSGTSILDVGTGGGFPGIPLAIYFPQCSFTLIDAIGKKIKVADSIAKSLVLNNVEAKQLKVEKNKNKYDFIVSRAVTALPKFYKISKKCISYTNKNALTNGIIYLKGGDFENELQMLPASHKLFDISNYFNETYFETKKIVYIPVNQ